jgi:hypothetical protein
MLFPRHTVIGAAALMLSLAALAPRALAVPAPVGTQAGHPVQAAAPEGHKKHSSSSCNVEVPVIGGLLGGACEAAEEAAAAAGGLVGEAAGAVGNGILDLVAKWMIGAATQVTTFVSREMQQTTTPQLQSAWYEAQFQPMADLGAALGLLVTMIAFASAAIRRSPEALAATLAGIARAGLGTGLVVALTVIGLGIADQVSSAVVSGSPHAFWATVAHAWGASGFGGFGSSALAMLIALVEVFAAIFVWLELIVRNAAIYVAVLFFPAALAAAIWPALSAWPGRLGRLLLLFVILKPVALIVLSLAGNAAAAGLSFSSGGVSGSVGTILAATVIFALAAFAPWTLMYLLAVDAESAYMAAGLRAAAGAAVADEDGRSVRSGGGLRNQGGQGSGGEPGGGAQGGGGSASGGGTGGGSNPLAGGPSAPGADAAAGGGGADGSLPVGAETIGAGSVGAAAGMSARAPLSSRTPEAPSASAGQDANGAQGGGAGAEESSTGAHATAASVPPPGNRHAVSSPTAGGASTGASSQRPSRGSAGATAPTEEQQPVQPAARFPEPSSGAPLSPSGNATHSVARSPRRRARSRSPVLAGVSSRPRPPQDRANGDEDQ